jgi:hypothetical protein
VKFLHLTYHFQYTDLIEDLLDYHNIQDYTRYSMVEGKDDQGKHFGTQVYPGNTSVVQAQVPEESVDPLLSDLREFRDEKKAHEHLEALILPIERRLNQNHTEQTDT